jgi:Protein of unknown function (DUF692)
VRHVAESADCGLLLDLHNVFTNSLNGRQRVDGFLDDLPLERVCEVHLAGVVRSTRGGRVRTSSAFARPSDLAPCQDRGVRRGDTGNSHRRSARVVRFDVEPLSLLRGLAEGRVPTEVGRAGDFEIELTAGGRATVAGLDSAAVQNSFPLDSPTNRSRAAAQRGAYAPRHGLSQRTGRRKWHNRPTSLE